MSYSNIWIVLPGKINFNLLPQPYIRTVVFVLSSNNACYIHEQRATLATQNQLCTYKLTLAFILHCLWLFKSVQNEHKETVSFWQYFIPTLLGKQSLSHRDLSAFITITTFLQLGCQSQDFSSSTNTKTVLYRKSMRIGAKFWLLFLCVFRKSKQKSLYFSFAYFKL